MALTKEEIKDKERWYKLPNEKQVHRDYFNSKARFTIVKAGRRSYKTEIAKRRVILEAMITPGDYFIAAPTIPQVRLIYWNDIKRMSFPSKQKAIPRESMLVRPFDNGSAIHLLGMEKPKRFEGPYWTGGILDEFAYYKPEAWTDSIRPALDTRVPGMPRPWCIILSKPNGQNHFFDLWQYVLVGQDPNWAYYAWTSEDVLELEDILAAKRELSLRTYQQEYLGMFVTQTGRIYDTYGKENNTIETIAPHEQIQYFCDFNFTPMSHGIGVIREIDGVKKVFVLDEIILESARGYYNVMEFCERYKNHQNKTICLYGDHSGANGEKHNIDSEYTLMIAEFKKHGWTVKRKVKDSNPAIKNRQNAVNAMIQNALGEIRLYVNQAVCKYMHKGLLTTVLKEGSSFLEEESDYQHITTALGYFIDYVFPIRYNLNINETIIQSPWG